MNLLKSIVRMRALRLTNQVRPRLGEVQLGLRLVREIWTLSPVLLMVMKLISTLGWTRSS